MKNAIELLLRIDFNHAARSIGLIAEQNAPLLTEENLYSIINEIELALLEGGREKEISSICGLLWTHFGKEFDLLAQYVFSVMARIGFSPVARMLSSTEGDSRNLITTSSLLSMLETAVQIEDESITVFEVKYRLTRFQKQLWNELKSKKHVAVSAPTSAGKSFLICLNLVYGSALRKGTSVYIVPTLTLLGQVMNDLVHLAQIHSLKLDVRTHLTETNESNHPIVYVVTQERLTDHANLFASIKSLNYLIVDEVQNIERAFDVENNDSRAKLLLDVIVDLHDRYSPAKTVISGPRISEISVLGEKLFRSPCAPVTVTASPVTNICYSITPHSSDKKKIVLTQYSELNLKHISKICDNSIGANGFGKSLYNEAYHAYLSVILKKNKDTLIFSPTSGQARKTALRLAGDRPASDNGKLKSLAQYIEDTVATTYDLAICIRKGVAFHHGKMPHHVRNAIELAICQGLMGTVACTTTLMQGVNIPARNVIMRNPNLFVRGRGLERPRLSGYEIANLRGRAGRLLRDFVGRTFILDGTSFEEAEEQLSLFQPSVKKMDGSYSTVFEKNRKEIVEALTISSSSNNRNSLAKYIGNVLYTEPDGASRLARKGIHISDSDLIRIKRAQQALTVDKQVCRSHRYWDPFDLQIIHEHRASLEIPASPFVSGAATKLSAALVALTKLLPFEAEHFLGKRNTSNDRKLWVVAKMAIDWANETPLKTLLDNDYTKMSSDNTDASISLLQNTISYGVPALLSPLYAIARPGALMLGAIERGAFQPSSIVQINNNIPRETALALSRKAKHHKIELNNILDVLHFAKNADLSYWDVIQYRHLMDISGFTHD